MGLIVLGFLVLRLPPVLHQAGRIDEECYAVPGLTILECGLPQLPHLPSRNPQSMFYRADEILFSEPPLYFYLHALLYLVLPATYGTARLPSMAAACLMLWLLFHLSRRWTGSSTAALWTVGLFALSRWLFYPATIARADMAAALAGLAAVGTVVQWQATGRQRWLIASGACLGLGGLLHFLVIVPAVQIAAWLMLTSRGQARLTQPLLVAAVALAVFALWLPMILLDPELFRIQFHNQFLKGPTGATLFWILRPLDSLWYHGRFLWLSMNPWQSLLIGVPFLWSLGAVRLPMHQSLRVPMHLTWSSFLFLGLLVGTHHDVPGYWAYPAALGFVGTGAMIVDLDRRLTSARLRSAAVAVRCLGTVLLVAAMIPGAGAKLLLTHLRHWNDENYNAPRFAQRLLHELPAEARYTVDYEYLLDFFAAGRKVIGHPNSPIYLDAENQPYDYLLLGRQSLKNGAAAAYCAEPLSRPGIETDELACYTQIFRPSPMSCRSNEEARPSGE